MLEGVERQEAIPNPAFKEAYLTVRKLLTRQDLAGTPSFHIDIDEDSFDFEMDMTLKSGVQIEAEGQGSRIEGRILIGGERRVGFALSQEAGLEGLVFFNPHLRVFYRGMETGAKIGIGLSDLSINPVPAEKRRDYANLVTPFVEWFEKFVKSEGNMSMMLEITP